MYLTHDQLRRCTPCAHPNAPSYDADIDAAEEDVLAVIAGHVFDERMASATWVEDAFGELTRHDFKVMAMWIARGHHKWAGEAMRASVERLIRADAQKEARVRLERMRDEDAADAAAERMED
jgi:hypothetical protein